MSRHGSLVEKQRNSRRFPERQCQSQSRRAREQFTEQPQDRHVMHAQNQKIDARRTQIQQTYTQKLHTF